MRSRVVEPVSEAEGRPEGAPAPLATPEPRAGGSPPPPLRRLLLEGLGVVALVQALQFLFLPALRTRGQTFYEELLVNALGPEKHGLYQWFHEGFLPFWTRNQLAGEPYIANISHGALYPGNIPYYLLSTSAGLKVVTALHLVLAGVGMWAYCRVALRTGTWGAVLSGLAYAFGGLMLLHVSLSNQMQVAAWLPVVLLFGHLALERGQLRYVVATALAIGMQFLCGHPEWWLYTMAMLALYGVVWTFGAGLRAWPRRALAGALRLGGSVMLFVLLFGWQLLPTLQLQRLGYRTGPGFSEQHPLPKAVAVNAMLPDFGHVLIGENVSSIGVVALGLAALGIAAGRRDLRWVRVFLGILVVAGYTMALGNQVAPYRIAYDTVGLVSQLRVPVRWLLLPYFGLAAAAGLGTEVLLTRHIGRLRERAVQAGLAAVALLVFAVALFGLGDLANPSASLRWWILAAAAGAVIWAAATIPAVPRVLLASSLIAVLVVELNRAEPRAAYHQVAPSILYNDPGPVMRLLASEGGRYVTDADLPHTAAQKSSIPKPPDILGQEANYFYVGYYNRINARPSSQYSTDAQTILARDGGLMPTGIYRDFFVNAVNGHGDVTTGRFLQPPSQWKWAGLDFLGVRLFVTAEDLPASERRVLEEHGFRVLRRVAYVDVWERPQPPLARMEYDVDVVPSAAERIARLEAGYPLADRAIVEKPIGPVGQPRTRPSVGTRVGETKVSASVTTDAAGVLVLADPWYPAWRVTVDGKRSELLRLDHAFRGVRVPAGTHTVVFAYQDPLMRGGAILAPVTVLALVGCWLVRRGNRHQPGRGDVRL
jgi:Bacterial membrane protein YfhO